MSLTQVYYRLFMVSEVYFMETPAQTPIQVIDAAKGKAEHIIDKSMMALGKYNGQAESDTTPNAYYVGVVQNNP